MVDGISDQSLANWSSSFGDSPFAGYFDATWVGSPPQRIKFARDVIQWNGKGSFANKEEFERWLNDVASIDLTPDIALTDYNGEPYPANVNAYEVALESILSRARELGHPIAYVEPWNEPNGQGGMKEDGRTATTAAEFASAAYSTCPKFGCTVIAGNFDDGPKVTTYEQEYEAALKKWGFTPTVWGVHPYYAVEDHTSENMINFEKDLPNGGRGDELWFTEVGAYYCLGGVRRGATELQAEERQARDASYLVNVLMTNPQLAPAHVFYYGFMYGDHQEVPCEVEGDTELYKGASETPREAAAVIAEGPATQGNSQPLARDLTIGDQWLYYAGHGGSLWTDSWSGVGWSNSQLPLSEPMSANTTAPVLQETVSGDQWVYFIGANRQVWSDSWTASTSSWTNAPLPTGGEAASDSSPAVVRDAATRDQWVYYAGANGQLWTDSWNTGTSSWTNSELPPVAEVASNSSPAVVRDAWSGDQWVYYVGANGQLWTDSFDASTSTWTNYQLLADGGQAAANASPTVIRDIVSGDQWVYYVGANGQLWTDSFDATTSTWTNYQLLADGGQVAAYASPSVARDINSGDQWVYYVGTNGQLWTDSWDTSTGEWSNYQLPTGAEAEP